MDIEPKPGALAEPVIRGALGKHDFSTHTEPPFAACEDRPPRLNTIIIQANGGGERETVHAQLLHLWAEKPKRNRFSQRHHANYGKSVASERRTSVSKRGH